MLDSHSRKKRTSIVLATKLEGYFVSSASINPNQSGNWQLDMGSCLNKFENVQIWHGGWLAGSKKNKARHKYSALLSGGIKFGLLKFLKQIKRLADV